MGSSVIEVKVTMGISLIADSAGPEIGRKAERTMLWLTWGREW